MALGETETQQQQNEKCWRLDKGFFPGFGAEAWAGVSLTNAEPSEPHAHYLPERNSPRKLAEAFSSSTEIRLEGLKVKLWELSRQQSEGL